MASPAQVVQMLRDDGALLDASTNLGDQRDYLQSLARSGRRDAQEAGRPKELEVQNKKLKEIVAELTLDNRMLTRISHSA